MICHKCTTYTINVLVSSTPVKHILPPSGVPNIGNNEPRAGHVKGVVGGISILGNAGPAFIASMKEKSSSLSKIGGSSQTSQGGSGSKVGVGTPKKHSFGKGTAAPSHPAKPKAPSLPVENIKSSERDKGKHRLFWGCVFHFKFL